jgi:hypothetical protein
MCISTLILRNKEWVNKLTDLQLLKKVSIPI